MHIVTVIIGCTRRSELETLVALERESISNTRKPNLVNFTTMDAGQPSVGDVNIML
jgi:hypothetical protein